MVPVPETSTSCTVLLSILPSLPLLKHSNEKAIPLLGVSIVAGSIRKRANFPIIQRTVSAPVSLFTADALHERSKWPRVL
jgi:hypothetical protein